MFLPKSRLNLMKKHKRNDDELAKIRTYSQVLQDQLSSYHQRELTVQKEDESGVLKKKKPAEGCLVNNLQHEIQELKGKISAQEKELATVHKKIETLHTEITEGEKIRECQLANIAKLEKIQDNQQREIVKLQTIQESQVVKIAEGRVLGENIEMELARVEREKTEIRQQLDGEMQLRKVAEQESKRRLDILLGLYKFFKWDKLHAKKVAASKPVETNGTGTRDLGNVTTGQRRVENENISNDLIAHAAANIKQEPID